MWSMFGKWLKFTPDWRAFLGRQQPLPGHSYSSEPCAGENPSAVIRILLWSGAKVPGVVGAGQGGCWSFLGSPTSDHSVIFFITVLVCKTRQESLIGLCLTLVTWTGGIRKYRQMLSLSLKNWSSCSPEYKFPRVTFLGKKMGFFFLLHWSVFEDESQANLHWKPALGFSRLLPKGILPKPAALSFSASQSQTLP